MDEEKLQQMLEANRKDILEQVKQMMSQFSSPEEPHTSPEPPSKEEALIRKITDAINKQSDASAAKVFETMFNESLEALTSRYPAFGEYLESEDDYGKKIIDQIRSTGDYEGRKKVLDTVFRRFAEANANSDSSSMCLTRKAREEVEKSESVYDDLTKKLDNGEISLAQFQTQFFDNVADQLAKMSGNS